ncbi:hypothetical protein HJC23_000620 [Cyclotella cryptica]|uniref:Uncharacterized protein n=1 Tax=Cyclotella cryptica TaxID=29204 RepID=A0ABD3Q7R9_9STRA|eukprot:CCRYP_008009-RA/>CCRYP_008009-RA protein AED:0.13 eAED:0.13 QI:0/-1/0/1/-1/1/1/0/543
MGKPKIPPPSKIDALSFPVFGLAWYGHPSNIGNGVGAHGDQRRNNRGVSALAYCGGGGSSKTGVLNKIVVVVTTDGHGGSVTRQIDVSTGEALCFGVHVFRPYDDDLDMIRLLACVGDELLLYGIPIAEVPIVDGADENAEDQQQQQQQENNVGAVLLGKVNVGQGYGASVTTYTPIHRNGVLHHCVAVGCENGIVVLYELKQQQPQDIMMEFIKIAECTGHTKAVCSINFHPRGTDILSSAKDGTARIFCTQTGLQLGVMECEVHDPKDPPPLKPEAATNVTTKDPRMMKRPPQILVRGCAYGDLEGKTIYTIASGKRGPAYLTKWKTLVPLASTMPSAPTSSSSSSSPSSNRTLSIRQEYRIQCSPVPISATSLSSDGTLLALGSVEGSILLYNLETKSVLKQFQGHDLPVTCLASRPIPNALMLPGELEGGVNYDAVSASADNRLGRWTLQRKSRIVVPRQRRMKREMNALESFLWSIIRIPLLLFVIVVLIAVHDVLDICHEEVKLPALMTDVGAAGHCVYREVLWAESTRPGVRSVPE